MICIQLVEKCLGYVDADHFHTGVARQSMQSRLIYTWKSARAFRGLESHHLGESGGNATNYCPPITRTGDCPETTKEMNLERSHIWRISRDRRLAEGNIISTMFLVWHLLMHIVSGHYLPHWSGILPQTEET